MKVKRQSEREGESKYRQGERERERERVKTIKESKNRVSKDREIAKLDRERRKREADR